MNYNVSSLYVCVWLSCNPPLPFAFTLMLSRHNTKPILVHGFLSCVLTTTAISSLYWFTYKMTVYLPLKLAAVDSCDAFNLCALDAMSLYYSKLPRLCVCCACFPCKSLNLMFSSTVSCNFSELLRPLNLLKGIDRLCYHTCSSLRPTETSKHRAGARLSVPFRNRRLF